MILVTTGDRIADVERRMIEQALAHTEGYKPAAAALVGISLKTLYNKCARYARDDVNARLAAAPEEARA